MPYPLAGAASQLGPGEDPRTPAGGSPAPAEPRPPPSPHHAVAATHQVLQVSTSLAAADDFTVKIERYLKRGLHGKSIVGLMSLACRW